MASAILSFMGSLAILSGADKFLTKLIYHQKFRMNTFYLKHAALKGLTTDYINQENGIFRKLQAESFECCNGNYSPLSNIYEILIKLCTSFLGLFVFGSMLIQVHLGIIIFLIIITVISYYLNQKSLHGQLQIIRSGLVISSDSTILTIFLVIFVLQKIFVYTK